METANILKELNKLPKEANYFGTVDHIKSMIEKIYKPRLIINPDLTETETEQLLLEGKIIINPNL